MEAWMAFISIMAIVAIVVVAGGLIAFIAHMILGVFDNGKQTVRKEYLFLEYFLSGGQERYADSPGFCGGRSLFPQIDHGLQPS